MTVMSNDKRESKGQPVGGQYANHNRDESAISLRFGPYVDMTPPAIDEELAGYYGERREQERKMWALQAGIKDVETFKRVGKRWGYRTYNDPDAEIAKLTEKIVPLVGLIQEIDTYKIDPIAQEFKARGGWTRFFLVTSSGGGHVHKSMSCSSCNYRTNFIWLTKESGKNEAEIVEKAGDGACTICWNSAPVADKRNPRPNPYEDPQVTANRAEKKAAKDAKAAKELINGIRTPEGEELREAPDYKPDGSIQFRGQLIKTERSAEIKGVDHLNDLLWREFRQGSDPAYVNRVPSAYEIREEQTYMNIVNALASKRGQTVDEVRELLAAKAAARFKRDNR